MNLGTLIPLILKLLPLIPQLKELTSNPVIKQILDIILPLVGELFPDTPTEKPQEVIDHVKWIQQSLNELGQTPKLVVDGSYGEMTKAAVKAFQTKAGVEVDGWVGPITKAKLEEALATVV